MHVKAKRNEYILLFLTFGPKIGDRIKPDKNNATGNGKKYLVASKILIGQAMNSSAAFGIT